MFPKAMNIFEDCSLNIDLQFRKKFFSYNFILLEGKNINYILCFKEIFDSKKGNEK